MNMEIFFYPLDRYPLCYLKGSQALKHPFITSTGDVTDITFMSFCSPYCQAEGKAGKQRGSSTSLCAGNTILFVGGWCERGAHLSYS